MPITQPDQPPVRDTQAPRRRGGRFGGWLLLALGIPLLAACLLGLALGDTGPARTDLRTLLDRALLAASLCMVLGGLLILLRQKR